MLKYLLGVGLFTIVLGSARAEFIIADSINASRTNGASSWAASEVGWIYTPGHSYDLVGVQTKFGSVDDRTVTLEVYDDHPGDGGSLLRTADFAPSTSFAGGAFSALGLSAGETYFVGFRNVAGLGVNVTEEADATAIASGLRFGFFNEGVYGEDPEFGTTSQPILQFLSETAPTGGNDDGDDPVEPAPEPSGLVLGTIGALSVSLGWLRRRRRTRRETATP